MKKTFKLKPGKPQEAKLAWKFDHEAELTIEMARSEAYLTDIDNYLRSADKDRPISFKMVETLTMAEGFYKIAGNPAESLWAAERLAESVIGVIASKIRPLDERIADARSLPARLTRKYRREIVAVNLEACSDCTLRARPAVKELGRCAVHYLRMRA